MEKCHAFETIMSCRGCGRRKTIVNRCDQRWCPLCVPRLARRRTEELTWWVKTLRQPKHVVLTARNTATLSRGRVARFRQALRKLRESTFCAKETWWREEPPGEFHAQRGCGPIQSSAWRSGTWALEVTNESRGWHLHAHLLVDSRWIDARVLASRWAHFIGQDVAIVKVKDCRGEDYLREVAKYVVKSSQIASWVGLDIACLIDAFKRTRTFGVFGTLVGERQKWRQFLKEHREPNNQCACGCKKFTFTDARVMEMEPKHQRSWKK